MELSADGSFKKWGLRFLIITLVSLVGFVAKTEDSRLNLRVDELESSSVTDKVMLGRLEEKLDAVKSQLDRIERKGFSNGQN